jgi:hypothetical protein
MLRVLQLKNADEVEFWHSPDKEGWLLSQGEVIKTWRRRWFVLKDGFIFRFLENKVTHASKPRGIVDLSKVCFEELDSPKDCELICSIHFEQVYGDNSCTRLCS